MADWVTALAGGVEPVGVGADRDHRDFSGSRLGWFCRRTQMRSINVLLGIISLFSAFPGDISTQASGAEPVKEAGPASAHLVVRLGHFGAVTAVAFAPGGKQVATASDDRTARLWDCATGCELRWLEGHNEGITSLAFSPDGRQLLTGSQDKTARLWDATTGKEISRYGGHAGNVVAVGFSAEGRQCITVAEDGIRVWDVGGLGEKRHFGDTGNDVVAALSADGRRVVCGRGKAVALWDIELGTVVWRSQGLLSDDVSAVAFSRDGKHIVTGMSSASAPGACLWEVATGKILRQYRDLKGPVHAVAFSPDGSQLLVSSAMSELRSVGSGDRLRFVAGSVLDLAVAFSPDGRLVVAGGRNSVAILSDARVGTEVQSLTPAKMIVARLNRGVEMVNVVEVAPDGRSLLIAGGESVRIWSLVEGRVVCQSERHRGVVEGVDPGVTAAAWVEKGRSFVTGDYYGICLWDLATGRTVAAFGEQGAPISAIAVTRDGQRILVAANDGSVTMWDRNTARRIRTLVRQSDSPARQLLFSPDGATAAIVAGDVTVYQTNDAKILRNYRVPPLGASCAAMSCDGARLLVGSWLGDVHLVEVVSSKSVLVWPRPTEEHRQSVRSLAFSPDGQRAAAGFQDGAIRIREVADGKEVRAMKDRSPIVSVRFSEDGKWLFAGTKANTQGDCTINHCPKRTCSR